MPGRRESLVVICAILLFISASTTALSLNTTVSNGPKRTILSGGEFYDIDGDGYKDLLLAGSGQKADLSVWFGGTSGTWTTQGLALNLGINTNLAKQKSYELIDANRDFVADILVGKTDAVPTMWLSNGDRKYKRVPFPLPSAALSIASCDLDADGYNDLVFLFNNGIVSIRYNLPTAGLFHSQNVTISIPSDAGFTNPYPTKLVCVGNTTSSASFAVVCGDNWCAPLSLPDGVLGTRVNVTAPTRPLEIVSEAYKNDDGSATVVVVGGLSIGFLRIDQSSVASSNLYANISASVPSAFGDIFASGSAVSWAVVNETAFSCSFWASTGSYVFVVSSDLATVDTLFSESSSKYLSFSPKTSGFASEPEIIIAKTDLVSNVTEIVSTGLALFPVVTPGRIWYRTGSAVTITINGANFGSSVSNIAVNWRTVGCDNSVFAGGCPSAAFGPSRNYFTCSFGSITGKCDLLAQVSVSYSDTQKNRTTGWRLVGASSQSRLTPIDPPARRYFSGAVARTKINFPVADTPPTWPGAIADIIWTISGSDCSGTLSHLCPTTYQVNVYGFSCDVDINVVFPTTGLVSNPSTGCSVGLTFRTAGGALIGPSTLGYITQPLLISDYSPQLIQYGATTFNVTLQSNYGTAFSSGIALNGVFDSAELPTIASSNSVSGSFQISSGPASIQFISADFLETTPITLPPSSATLNTRVGVVPINATLTLRGTRLPTSSDGSVIALTSLTSSACNTSATQATAAFVQFSSNGTTIVVRFTASAAAAGCEVVATLTDFEGVASAPTSVGTFQTVNAPNITAAATYQTTVALSSSTMPLSILGSGLPIATEDIQVLLTYAGSFCAVANAPVNTSVVSASASVIQVSIIPPTNASVDSCEIFARVSRFGLNSTQERVGRIVGTPILAGVPTVRVLTPTQESTVNVSFPITGTLLPADPQEPVSVSIVASNVECQAALGVSSVADCVPASGPSLACVIRFSNISNSLDLYDCLLNATVRRQINGLSSGAALVLRTTFRPSVNSSVIVPFDIIPEVSYNITLSGLFFPRNGESFTVLLNASSCSANITCSNASIIVSGVSFSCQLSPIPAGCGTVSAIINRGDVSSESILIGTLPDAPTNGEALDPLPGGVVATVAQIGGLRPQEIAGIVIGVLLAVVLFVFTILLFLIRTQQSTVRTPRAAATSPRSAPTSPRNAVEMTTPAPVTSPRRPLPELSESSSSSSTSLSSLGWSENGKQDKKPAVKETSGSASGSESSESES